MEKSSSFDFEKEIEDCLQNSGELDRAIGCVVGAFLGDSIGSYLEFKTNVSDNDISKALTMPGGGPFLLARGQITDDSELALCLAKGLVESKGEFDVGLIAKYYGYWIRSSPFDCGNTIGGALQALGKAKMTDDPVQQAKLLHAQAMRFNGKSHSNGGLMRITPLAVFCSRIKDENQIATIIKEEQTLTHPSDTSVQTAITYCLAIRELINGSSGKEAFEFVMKWIQNSKNLDMKQYQRAAQSTKLISGTEQMGWAKIAWSYSFNMINRDEISFKKAMIEILKQGGDTDTNCAIAGGMVGAAMGFKKLYEECKDQVKILFTCEKLNRKRDEFYRPRNILNMTRELMNPKFPPIFNTSKLELDTNLEVKNLEFKNKDGKKGSFVDSIANFFTQNR